MVTKFVARDMVLEWVASGSTTVTTFSGQARNLNHGSTVDDADATGYGDANRQHKPTIKDESLDFELFLDELLYTVEDLFLAENEGTLTYYPAGKVVGRRKVAFPGYVQDSSDHYPYDGIAMKDVSLLPTGTVTRGTHTT